MRIKHLNRDIMKNALLLTCFLFIMNIVNAQEALFLKGDKKINVGVGIHNYPIGSLSLDYGLIDGIFDDGTFGVGPYLGVGFSSLYTYFAVGGRGSFHYPLVEDLDTYVGASLGVRFATSSYRENGSLFTPGIFIGANYPVSKNIVLFGEIGSAVTYLNVGITLVID